MRPTITGQLVKPEPFTITSFTGAPGAVTLNTNVANQKSLIATFTLPQYYRFVFDPDDPYQEVLFTPFGGTTYKDTKTIIGKIYNSIMKIVNKIFHRKKTHEPIVKDENSIKDENFIIGDIEVTLEGATGKDVRRLFHSDTLYMRPSSLIFKVGHLRKWQHKMIGVPGDLLRVYFTSKKVFNPKNSVLAIRVRAGKIVL